MYSPARTYAVVCMSELVNPYGAKATDAPYGFHDPIHACVCVPFRVSACVPACVLCPCPFP
jgi:hypothetical protein